MKNNNHDPNEPVDKQQYKKRYLLRKQEEQEADQQMKELHEDEREQPQMPEA